MKTILLPTDFSKNSLNAIYYAMELFENEVCNFYVLNVQKASSFITDDMLVVSSSATIYNTIVDAAKKSIANIISKVKKRYNNKKHSFHSIVDYDNFIDSINQISDKYDIDLIVMGTKGASGLEKVIFGSNTVRVIQRCKVPVLAIPNGCKFNGFERIAFIADAPMKYRVKDFTPLSNFMLRHQSTLDVLQVINDKNTNSDRQQCTNFFEEHFSNVTYSELTIGERDMYNIIHDFMVTNAVSLLAMVDKKHSFLERLFTTHTVEAFAFKVDIPFLVMKHSTH
ncbi:universal stress protein [Snuella sedimenti]|uniref:Universal stress protein n=1 Tax=Snuella sedimenti TaxID=2798802 RepID=A0A8J7LRC4_9FLAO|nr:universal stress protein [Snuella sedimenti]MBJ6367020.1 universal stress protein [Snuella sedimenti]